MKTNFIKFLLAAGVALTGILPSHASAANIFNFGPSTSYVTNNTAFSRSANKTGSGPWTYLNPFSDISALSPESDYSGPVFYGGYTMTSSSVQGSSLEGTVLNNWSLIGNNDALRIYANLTTGWNNSTLGFASAYLFKQSDFAEPYNTGNFALDGLSVTYRASGASGAFTPTGRWIVQVDGAYYLSQATITSQYNTISTVSLSGAALTSTTWAAYNPSSNLFFEDDATFSPLDLSKVTAVGIYFEMNSYLGTSDNSAALLAISAFSASGTVIPEPAVATLFLPGSLVGCLLLRRMRSSRR